MQPAFRLTGGALGAALLFLSLPAQSAEANQLSPAAPESTLNTVTVVGNWLENANETKVLEHLGARTIVDRETFQESGANNVRDVLRRVPGVQVQGEQRHRRQRYLAECGRARAGRAPVAPLDSPGDPRTSTTYQTQESANGALGDIPGYALMNMRLGYDFGKSAQNLKVAFGVKNVFDKRYFTRSTDNNAGKYVGMPRTFYIQASLAY